MLALQSALGFFAIFGIVWLISENRRAVPWRIVAAGALLQIFLAALLLWVPVSRDGFLAFNDLLSALEKSTQEGTRFVFGFLGGEPSPMTRAQFATFLKSESVKWGKLVRDSGAQAE